MKLTITSIELKNPFKFFSLSYNALSIIRQLEKTNCKGFKKTGFWTKHYTMTLWNDDEEIIAFYKNGAHLKAMKESKKIAKKITSITVDRNNFLDWKEAKLLLKQGKSITF